MQKEKAASILSSIVLLLLGMGCCVGNALLTLQPSAGTLNFRGESVDLRRELIVALIVLLLVAIASVEWGAWWIRQSLAMQDIRESYQQSNIWTKIARLRLNIGLAISVIAVPVLLILIAIGLVSFVAILGRNATSLPVPFLVFLGACAVYVVLRIPAWIVWRLVGADVSKLARSVFGLPTYKLVDGGVVIDLYPNKIAIGPSVSTEFRVGFDELDEVRGFSYAEAQSYLADIVGPDIDMWLRQAKAIGQFPGKIPRPTVYRDHPRILGANVLMRGPGLFYLIGFNADDASDLVDAFLRYKGLEPEQGV